MADKTALADVYYEQLTSSDNKIKVLVNFYRAVFSPKNSDQSIYQTFGRLVKLYGAELIFFALLDCYDVENINLDSVSRLISYFAKKRLESRLNFELPKDLGKMSADNVAKFNKPKRATIPEIKWE